MKTSNMTEQQIREKFNKHFSEMDTLTEPELDIFWNFLISIRTQEREELEKKIDGMMSTEEEIETQKENGEYNCYSKENKNETLLDIKALLKEQ